MVKRFPTSSGSLFFGELPKVAVLKHLKSRHIDAIWNLAAELKMMVPYEKNYAPEVIFGNIKDYSEPSDSGVFIAQLNRIISLLRAGKKVFVHCFAGHGRTGTALAAIKVAMDHMPAEEALEIAFNYTTGPESEKQEEYIEKLDTLYNGAPKKPKRKKKTPLWNYKNDSTQPLSNFRNIEDYTAYLKKKWDEEDRKSLPRARVETEKQLNPSSIEALNDYYRRQEEKSKKLKK